MSDTETNVGADRPTLSAVPLTFREVRFANAYLEHGNATQAAKDAGFQCVNDAAYSQMGYSLLRKPELAEYLHEVRAEFLDAEKTTAKKIAQRLSQIAFGDRSAIFGADGQVLDPKSWPAAVRASILSIDVRESIDRHGAPIRTHKIKFSNATEALRILAEWKRLTGAHSTKPEGELNGGRMITVIVESPTDGEDEGGLA